MIAKTAKQRVVALRFGAQNGAQRRLGENGRERFSIGNSGIHPEFGRVGHGPQPVECPGIGCAAFYGIQVGYIEGRERVESAQSRRDRNRIGTCAERRDDRQVAVAPAHFGADDFSAFQVENRDDAQRFSPNGRPFFMKA